MHTNTILHDIMTTVVDGCSRLSPDCHPSCRSCVGPLASDCLRCLKTKEVLVPQYFNVEHGVCAEKCPNHRFLDHSDICRGEWYFKAFKGDLQCCEKVFTDFLISYLFAYLSYLNVSDYHKNCSLYPNSCLVLGAITFSQRAMSVWIAFFP